MASVISEHIEITPDVCGGKPRIAGRRTRVQDIVIWHDHWAYTPEQIVSEIEGLTLADVYAALAYYHDHHDEIQGFIEQEKEFAARLEAVKGSILDRHRTNNAPNDSLPS